MKHLRNNSDPHYIKPDTDVRYDVSIILRHECMNEMSPEKTVRHYSICAIVIHVWRKDLAMTKGNLAFEWNQIFMLWLRSTKYFLVKTLNWKVQ